MTTLITVSTKYRVVQSLCCTHETNITLYVNNTSVEEGGGDRREGEVKKKEKEKERILKEAWAVGKYLTCREAKI